jgi:hypothetical protein
VVTRAVSPCLLTSVSLVCQDRSRLLIRTILDDLRSWTYGSVAGREVARCCPGWTWWSFALCSDVEHLSAEMERSSPAPHILNSHRQMFLLRRGTTFDLTRRRFSANGQIQMYPACAAAIVRDPVTARPTKDEEWSWEG